MKQDICIRLLHEHSDYLVRFATGMVGAGPQVDDLVSETIIKTYRHRLSIKHELYFKTYITRILINLCHDYHRKHKEVYEYNENIHLSQETRHEYDFVHEYINQLTPDLRTVIVMRYILEYSFVEISDILNIPESTLKSRAKKALLQLRVTMEDLYE